MGLFDIFKKKTATSPNMPNIKKQESKNTVINPLIIKTPEKEDNIQINSVKTGKQPCNNKPSSLNKRCCSRCGVNLDLLEPKYVILNEADNKEYCDICIEKLNSKKEYAISVGTRIILKNETICTPDMGGYPVHIDQQLIVCENGYLIITITRDLNGDETYHEEIIEKGFFAKYSITEIAIRLGLHDIHSNYKLLKLMEYDKIVSGQSL